MQQKGCGTNDFREHSCNRLFLFSVLRRREHSNRHWQVSGICLFEKPFVCIWLFGCTKLSWHLECTVYCLVVHLPMPYFIIKSEMHDIMNCTVSGR